MKKRLKALLAYLCFAISIGALFMWLHGWANGRTENARWAFTAMLTGWIVCLLLRRERDANE